MASLLIEIGGWIGTAFVLTAYLLLTLKKLNGESRAYHTLNFFGGLAIAINSVSNFAYPPAALNFSWALIAIYGISKGLKLFKKK